MLRDIIVTVKIRFVMGPCLNGLRVWKKVNLLQEIPFATQQAWHRKQRKGKKVQGQCMHASESATLFQSRTGSSISIACPNLINGCEMYPDMHSASVKNKL